MYTVVAVTAGEESTTRPPIPVPTHFELNCATSPEPTVDSRGLKPVRPVSK
jgi:hypothetical protein